MKNLKRLFGALSVVLLSLLLCELTVRLFYQAVQDFDAETWRYARQMKTPTDDDRLSRQIPLAKGKYMGVQIELNSMGHRGPERHANDRLKVLVLGDSLTLGWGVPQEKTFTALLEKHFPKVEFWNLGVPNYNLKQSIAGLEALANFHSSDILLYAFYLNDLEPAKKDYVGFWQKYSFLYFTLVKTYRRFSAPTQPKIDWPSFEADLKKLARLSEQKVLILLPDLQNLEGTEEKYERVSSLGKNLGFAVFNLQPLYKGPHQSLWVAKDDPHPNTEAHEKFAKKIASFLKASSKTLN